MFALMPRSCGCFEPSRPAKTDRFSQIEPLPVAGGAAAAAVAAAAYRSGEALRGGIGGGGNEHECRKGGYGERGN